MELGGGGRYDNFLEVTGVVGSLKGFLEILNPGAYGVKKCIIGNLQSKMHY